MCSSKWAFPGELLSAQTSTRAPSAAAASEPLKATRAVNPVCGVSQPLLLRNPLEVEHFTSLRCTLENSSLSSTRKSPQAEPPYPERCASEVGVDPGWSPDTGSPNKNVPAPPRTESGSGGNKSPAPIVGQPRFTNPLWVPRAKGHSLDGGDFKTESVLVAVP